MWRILAAVLFAALPSQAGDILDNLLWRNPLPTGNNLEAVTFGNQSFVAIADSEILSSTNALDWAAYPAPTTNHLHDVVYGQNKFVAVGDAGTVLTSSNGSDWIRQSSGLASTLNSAAYGDNRFVVIGGGGIYYSDNAVAWTLSLSGSFSFSKITYGDGKFVVLNGKTALVSTNAVVWSTNAIAGISTSFQPYDIDYGNGLFIAVGDQDASGIPFPRVLKSSDATNWQVFSSSAFLRFVGFGPNLYVSGGIGAFSRGGLLQTSPDGVQWTLQASNLVATPKDIAFGNGRYVAVGESGSVVVSADGTNWFTASGGENKTLTGVSFGDAGYVAVGDLILYSRDGFQFALQSSNAASAIAYGNKTYAATAGALVLESTNATGWTPHNAGGASLLSITFGNGLFVAAGVGGTIRASSNARAWSGRFSGTSDDLYGVVYGNNRWIVVGGWGTVLSSTDTLTWTGQNSDTLNYLFGVAYGNGQYVAVGGGGTILTSSDGETWFAQNSGVTTDLISVAYGRGIFVASGDLGTEFLSSTNGVHWVRRALPIAVYPSPRVAFLNDTFMFVGGKGMILQTLPETITLSGGRLRDGIELVVRGGPTGAILNLERRTGMAASWQSLLTFTNALPLVRRTINATPQMLFIALPLKFPEPALSGSVRSSQCSKRIMSTSESNFPGNAFRRGVYSTNFIEQLLGGARRELIEEKA